MSDIYNGNNNYEGKILLPTFALNTKKNFDVVADEITSFKNKYPPIFESIYTNTKSEMWNKDDWVFQINTLPTKNKMLCVIYTDKTKKDNSITIRGVYASPATYTGNISGMSSLMSNGQQVFYGYFTPGADDARMYFTAGVNTTKIVESRLAIYDISKIDIPEDHLIYLLEYGEIDGFLADSKNIMHPLNKALEAIETISLHKNDSILDHPDGSVTTEKIADNSITFPKLADNILSDLGGAKLISNIYTDNNNKAWNKDNYVFTVTPIVSRDRMLLIVSTNRIVNDITITARGVRNSPATYTGNSSVLRGIMTDNNTVLYYGYFTPVEEDGRLYFTVPTSTEEMIESTLKIYNATDVDIPAERLEIILKSGDLDGYLTESKNVTYPLAKAEEALKRIEALEGGSPKSIVCWGDSLTASGSGWTQKVQSQIYDDGYNYQVINHGIGGDNSNNIMNRMGAVPLYIKPFTLPSRSGANVSTNIQFYDTAFGVVKYQYPDDTYKGLKPCYINGVDYGYISNNSGNFVFTRTTDGEEIVFDKPVYLTFDNQKLNDQITIIWCGTNDINQSAEYIIERQKAMVEFLKTDKYVIIGLTCDIRHDVKSYNAEMAKVWGRKFLDVQKYLVEFGLSDNALTATADDESKIAEGLIPRQLMISDQIHFNEYGYKAIANCVYQYLKNEGYIAK